MSILLVLCLVMTCNKQKPPEILRTAPKPHVGFRRYRSITNLPGDKRAIVSIDTSSEGSIERTPPPFVKQVRYTVVIMSVRFNSVLKISEYDTLSIVIKVSEL